LAVHFAPSTLIEKLKYVSGLPPICGSRTHPPEPPVYPHAESRFHESIGKFCRGKVWGLNPYESSCGTTPCASTENRKKKAKRRKAFASYGAASQPFLIETFTIGLVERLTQCSLTRIETLESGCPRHFAACGSPVNNSAKESKVMIGKSTTPTQLCPYCANSIEENAAKCPYCKADLLSQSAPQWLRRDESSPEPRAGSNSNKKFTIPPKFIWALAMLVVVLTAFFAGGYIQRSEQVLSAQAYSKQLQAKDQIIQSQENQLADARKQQNDNANQLAEVKNKLEENQKELSVMRQRLEVTAREANRLNSTRSLAVGRTESRAPTAAPSFPAAARRTTEPGVYETTQATSVYENPSPGSRVISQISRGTRINVVSSAGDWLEVRSKHGNPPGYVRSTNARLLGSVN
jgi:hypothetical protein